MPDPELIPVYRVVRDGIPGIDGVYKTIPISSEFESEAGVERALERLTRRDTDKTIRIQRRWATPWEDVQ